MSPRARHGGEPAHSPETVDGRNIVASVIKATRIVECFTRGQPELSFSELVEATGYPTTTVHRLLATLELAGWVTRKDHGAYTLSLRIPEIASHVLAAINLRDEARATMQDISKQFGETVYLVLQQADHAVCVERVEGYRMVRVMAWDVGSVLPLYAGAAPLVLLAYQDRDEIRRIVDRDPVTLPTGHRVPAREMLRRLERIRAQGYSVSVEETIEGIASVGAPIFGSTGEITAALSAGGLASGFRDERLEAIRDALLAGAEGISRRLGYGGAYPVSAAGASG